MGYTNETLPKERARFWGRKLLPLYGVSPHEWWPNEDEEYLVVQVVTGEYFVNLLESRFGADIAKSVLSAFDQYAVFGWFTENFTKQQYTDDYRKSVTSSMVELGVQNFVGDVVEPWLADLKHSDEGSE